MADAKRDYLNAYTVEEYEDAKGKKARNWMKIGAAFPHHDGEGFSVQLRAFPVDGRVVLLPPNDDDRPTKK